MIRWLVIAAVRPGLLSACILPSNFVDGIWARALHGPHVGEQKYNGIQYRETF